MNNLDENGVSRLDGNKLKVYINESNYDKKTKK